MMVYVKEVYRFLLTKILNVDILLQELMGLQDMEVAADFFSIFPVNNTGFIKGRRIEVESDDISKTHIISIKSLDTGRIFGFNKRSYWSKFSLAI